MSEAERQEAKLIKAFKDKEVVVDKSTLKLSLSYKSSMSRDSLCKQISSNEESKQSALEGKILQFKKQLSATDACASEFGNGLCR